MPSIYISSELRALVVNERDRMTRELKKRREDGENVYVSEAEALENLLADGVQADLEDKRQ